MAQPELDPAFSICRTVGQECELANINSNLGQECLGLIVVVQSTTEVNPSDNYQELDLCVTGNALTFCKAEILRLCVREAAISAHEENRKQARLPNSEDLLNFAIRGFLSCAELEPDTLTISAITKNSKGEQENLFVKVEDIEDLLEDVPDQTDKD